MLGYGISDDVEVVRVAGEGAGPPQAGEDLVLRCRGADGSPEVRTEWLRNGERLVRGERIAFRGSGRRSLALSALRPSDSGRYSCRISNAAGSREASPPFALRLEGSDGLRALVLPEDVTALPGQASVRLDCRYSEPAALTEWYFGSRDEPLENSSRLTVFPNGSVEVRGLRPADEGLYKCVGISATSRDTEHQTFAARIRLAYLREFAAEPFEPPAPGNGTAVVAVEGRWEVTCLAPDGLPEPKVWWTDPGGRIVGDTGPLRVDGERLILEAARRNDSGPYTCVAENMAGRRTAFLDLQVADPPAITTPPESLWVHEKDPATLRCQVTGGAPYPLTKVRWLKNNKPLKSSSANQMDPRLGTLTIKSASLSDYAQYVCEVESAGFLPLRSAPANLTVRERLKFSSAPVSKNLELGASARLYCKARGGAGRPVVRWVPPGGLGTAWPPHIRDDNGTLHFNTVRPEDAGRYTCVATSRDDIINATVTIGVIVMAKFSVAPRDTEAYEGYPAMLHCQAHGDPPPTIQWDKNNVLHGFDDGRFSVLPNGTLFLSETRQEDQGKYGCTIGNSGGLRRSEISLTVLSGELYSRRSSNGEPSMTKTVLITLGAAAVYMVMVVGLMVWCRVRRARRKAALLAASAATADGKLENGDLPNGGTELLEKPPNSAKTCSTRSDSSAGSSRRSKSVLDRLHVARLDLKTVMLLGHGQFGEVYLAKAKASSLPGLADSTTATTADTVVMVKALQSRDEVLHTEFRREMDLFTKSGHDNLVRLLGVCRDGEPCLMVLEYPEWGDLKQFLLATRGKEGKVEPLTSAQAVGVCQQVCQAMEYLSGLRQTHGDLATRNCLVSPGLGIKLGKPALSRDAYSAEYFSLRNRPVPLRWAAPEAVLEDEWSTKSDVWAFAVLCWEVFSQAELPLSNLTDIELMAALKESRLAWQPPASAPAPFSRLLAPCWSLLARDRPIFPDLVLRIGSLIVDSKV
ncbi:PTK7 [Cordylochernes scorpioides]|uniref:PTK7 n=1 Tax=Cordylochernes scorpioides TaxID=51811 RepID=A0ABY6L4Q0_9ARAC|nr:PTK7 [Cordylochernes scorpioides]